VHEYIEQLDLEDEFDYGFALFYSDGRRTLHYGVPGVEAYFDPAEVKVSRLTQTEICLDSGDMVMRRTPLLIVKLESNCFLRAEEDVMRLIAVGNAAVAVKRLADSPTAFAWAFGLTRTRSDLPPSPSHR
jgi:hypothetical protein